LTVWFAAAWCMTADPGGVSALTMQKLIGLGSYQTAWVMLHRYDSRAQPAVKWITHYGK